MRVGAIQTAAIRTAIHSAQSHLFLGGLASSPAPPATRPARHRQQPPPPPPLPLYREITRSKLVPKTL